MKEDSIFGSGRGRVHPNSPIMSDLHTVITPSGPGADCCRVEWAGRTRKTRSTVTTGRSRTRRLANNPCRGAFQLGGAGGWHRRVSGAVGLAVSEAADEGYEESDS